MLIWFNVIWWLHLSYLYIQFHLIALKDERTAVARGNSAAATGVESGVTVALQTISWQQAVILKKPLGHEGKIGK